jgi:hypothetical protein
MRCQEELAGRRAKCKGCGKEFVIPSGTIVSKDIAEVESVMKIAKPLPNPTDKENEPRSKRT